MSSSSWTCLNGSTQVDCMQLDAVSCDSWDVPECCLSIEAQMREWLVWSNLVYLLPIVVLLSVRACKGHEIENTDWEYVYNLLLVMIASSVYHGCANVLNELPCYEYCYLNFQDTYNADCIAALLSIHTTLSVRWKKRPDVLHTFIVFTVVILGLWLIQFQWGIFTIGATVAVLDLSWRLATKQFNLLPSHHIGIILLVLSFLSLILAVLAQYSGVFSRPYGILHPIWHTMTALASLFFVVAVDENDTQTRYAKIINAM